MGTRAYSANFAKAAELYEKHQAYRRGDRGKDITAKQKEDLAIYLQCVGIFMKRLGQMGASELLVSSCNLSNKSIQEWPDQLPEITI